MTQPTRRKSATPALVGRAIAISEIVACLVVLMALSGFLSKLLAGTADPLAVGVLALLVVAVILSAIFAEPDRWNTSKIPGRRLLWFFLLAAAAGLAARFLVSALPAFDLIDDFVAVTI
jgi:hypothetical protein